MPELPEVHTISADLRKILKNAVIDKVLIANNYRVFPENRIFINTVKGKRVLNVSRIAKNIIWELEGDKYIRFHLAMTGRILIRNPKESPMWSKVAFRIIPPRGMKPLDIAFADMRMFGRVELVEGEDLDKLKAKYGPEPLDRGLTPEEFLSRIKAKRSTIKSALLNQAVISGLGNIYATDALFLAGIHPETKTKDLDLQGTTKLLKAAKQVLEEGIVNRGSTLPDKMYVDIFGKEGSQQNHFKIYLKTICDNCKGPVEFKKIAGRGTYYCPNCQL
ncbi:hypothetical protein A3K34_00305 [candidate division WWE3 bacterium RIFOXYC1_FULL_40_10]|uniref:Uncharacterized protein n=1 Tax=candidate division WWE3 bacterium RIFOXYA2_FULL_46_9 TaxID=1802636 RepID=A0A1F4W1F5_UNCKA|nr:MAG: hypothetical protein A3K58_00305 [candidate division WWE3 bacterium RIFOXYB1_FULL_40_22]OGC61334.1 MAG: hypothetical protein A3K37_00305 [candidate division WWE3 bacterium RIFOXYA1_FULL_40_11]OGC63244.1 MAG: hypothetical protein A2264_00960 [candidate division WWE3 bacterium RIFOXYA2_FULL_46_9]OGC65324.1 MAG: hypothetical protein A2326_04590 [candidate division WWE3 bacterium RIFOXYB2_FULL_41_6]OGC65717.1 MAG: hypothetical protein A3K34_00305 [candidate division WWE3 bacterium RIFOXYC1_